MLRFVLAFGKATVQALGTYKVQAFLLVLSKQLKL